MTVLDLDPQVGQHRFQNPASGSRVDVPGVQRATPLRRGVVDAPVTDVPVGVGDASTVGDI